MVRDGHDGRTDRGWPGGFRPAAAVRIGLARAREVGDLQDQAYCLWQMAELDRRAGRMADAGTHLRESLGLAAQTGDRLRLIDCLDTCGHICAATGRWAEAITMWAAHAAHKAKHGHARSAARRPPPPRTRTESRAGAGTRPGPRSGGTRCRDDPGGRRRVRCCSPRRTRGRAAPDLPHLSARERELVTLVARGRTDAQIAGQLSISVRTVRSRLDRIRDKTGAGAAPTSPGWPCRRTSSNPGTAAMLAGRGGRRGH